MTRLLGLAEAWRASSPRLALAFAIVLAAVLRLAWTLLVPNEPISDQVVYHVGAISLSEGRGFLFDSGNPNGFWPVGYSALLAGPYALLGSSVVVGYVTNIFFGLMLVAATFWAAEKLYDVEAAKLAALLAAIYPGLVGFVTILASENAYLPVQVAVVASGWLMFEAGRRGRMYLVLTGIALGVAILIRPPALALPAVVVVIGWARRAAWPSVLVKTGLTTALAVLVCVPWGLRNQATFGEFKLSAFNGGHVLWFGNHDGPPRIYVPERFQSLPLPERDKAMGAEALAHIRANPRQFVFRAAERAFVALRSETIPAAWNEVGLTRRLGVRALPVFKALFSLGYFALLGLVAVATFQRYRRSAFQRTDTVLLVGVLVGCVPFLLFDSQNRYHFPLLPFLMIYVGRLATSRSNAVGGP